MAYYTLEEKTNFWLCLSSKAIPPDIINYIWTIYLQQKNSSQPVEPKISIKTQRMMSRWKRNGQFFKHIRNIQFEDMDPRFIQF